MSVEANKEFVKQFLIMIGSGDAEGIASSYDAEGRVFTMGNTLISGVRGVDDIKQFVLEHLNIRETQKIRRFLVQNDIFFSPSTFHYDGGGCC